MEAELLEKLDHIVKIKNYANRSEAVRDFTREHLVEEEWKDPNKEVVGTLTLVYNHHARLLSDKLSDIQHGFHDRVIAATHVHLDAHNCAEVIILKGKSSDVVKISDRLIATKGVKHGKLVMTSTGTGLD
jgi:CopG family nickel-responsive transcriptional regulator